MDIEALHLAYVHASGLDLRLNPCSQRWWFDALKFNPDLTPDDVKLVVKWRLRQNSQQRSNWSIQLSRLIEGEDRLAVFEEHLAIAKAELRGRIDPARAEVMRATGRPEREEKPPVMAREAIRKGLDDLRKAMN